MCKSAISLVSLITVKEQRLLNKFYIFYIIFFLLHLSFDHVSCFFIPTLAWISTKLALCISSYHHTPPNRENMFLTAQDSWIAEISSQNSCRSTLNHFQSDIAWPNQSASVGEKEAVQQSGFSFDKNIKLLLSCRQCCSVVSSIRTGRHSLIKRRAKNVTEDFSLLLTGFRQSLVKHCGASWLAIRWWHISSVTPQPTESLALWLAWLAVENLISLFWTWRFIHSSSCFFCQIGPSLS